MPQVFARGARARGSAGDRRVHGRGAAQHSEGFRLLHGALIIVRLLFVFIYTEAFQTTRAGCAVCVGMVLHVRPGQLVVCAVCAGQEHGMCCMRGAHLWYVLSARGRAVVCAVCVW